MNFLIAWTRERNHPPRLFSDNQRNLGSLGKAREQTSVEASSRNGSRGECKFLTFQSLSFKHLKFKELSY